MVALDNQKDMVHYLMNMKATSAEYTSIDGLTPIHIAAMNGHYEIALSMVSKLTNIETTNLVSFLNCENEDQIIEIISCKKLSPSNR